MIDTFTLTDFEAALPVHNDTGERLWVALGLKQAEYTYRVVGPDCRVAIEVRSSVGANGNSAACGEDSIRAWLTDAKTGKPLGSKVTRWMTRLPGWPERLREVLRTLWLWRLRAGDCRRCGNPKGIWRVKKDNRNHGRPFAKCRNCDSGFVWLDEKPKTGAYFIEKVEDDLDVRPLEKLEALETLETASNTPPATGRGLPLLDSDGHIVHQYCSVCHITKPVINCGNHLECPCGHILEAVPGSNLADWIEHLETVSWYDASLARCVESHHDDSMPQDWDALRQLKEKYPQEVERYFPDLTAGLTLRRGRELLRGKEEVEI